MTAERSEYAHVLTVPTRWKDNDVYGHVNNVEYYSYFDTVINSWLISEGGLEIVGDGPIGVCAESACTFLAPVSFPQAVDAALRVSRIGRSSVTYELAIFAGGADHPAAVGSFVHVFVDRRTRRPTPIPHRLRTALERLIVPGGKHSVGDEPTQGPG